MPHFSDTIVYQEMRGSSDHEVSVDNPRSKRIFLVDWDDAQKFALQLTGQDKFITNGLTFFFNAKSDPERPNLVCKTCQISGLGIMGTSSLGTIQYQKARVEATFQPRPPISSPEQGNNSRSITFLTEKWNPTSEVITVPGDRLQWKTGDDAGKPVGEEASAIKYKPGSGYTLDIQYWFNPPLDVLLASQGKINNADFRAVDAVFPAKTLMFMNAPAQRQFTSDGAQAHQVTLNFNYNPEGWQKLFHPGEQDFVEVETASHKSLYKTMDFASLMPAGFSYA